MKKIIGIFSWQNITSTGFVFFFMWLLSMAGLRFDFLNVFDQVLQDYHLTDVYFTTLRDASEEPYDDRIVIVNIGSLDRRGIAKQIDIIAKHNPKVIGIDVLFLDYTQGYLQAMGSRRRTTNEVNYDPKEDTLANTMLADAISKTRSFVLGSMLQGGEALSSSWDTLLLPIPLLNELPNTSTGFVNIGVYEGSPDFATWRSIPPMERIKTGQKEPCFAAKVVEQADTNAMSEFIGRGNDIENIYFKGNIEKYRKLDVEDVLKEDFSPDMIEGKIVLLGYLGTAGHKEYFFDADRFYTPMNERSLGRGHPDMYGVVVHANIISMILDRKYIDRMPSWMGMIISVIICFANVVLFTFILLNNKLSPFYGVTKILQLAEILILAGVTLYLFSEFQYKADFSLAILAVLLTGDLVEIWVDIVLVSAGRFLAKISNRN